MTSIQNKLADFVLPPARGEVAVHSVTTSTEWHDMNESVTPVGAPAAIPNYWRGQYITIQADGADLYLAFSNNNSTAINPATAADAIGTDTCILVPNGQERTFLVPSPSKDPTAADRYRYLAMITAAGTCKARLWQSSREGPV